MNFLSLLLIVIVMSLLGRGECSMCGDFIEVAGNGTGELSSPNYPAHYPNNSVCIWLLQAPETHVVQLTLSFVQGEGTGVNCQDYIEIRDGSSTSTLQLKACTAAMTVVNSTGRWMWIKFISDFTNSNTGFYATHTGEYTPCKSTYLLCRNKECTSFAYRCDGVNDCGCVGSQCDEDGCGGIGWSETDRVICGICLGAALFFITFFGIGIYEIWEKKHAQKKYETEMEARNKRAKQERAQKQAASLGIPGIEVSTTGSVGSKTPTLSRSPSTLSSIKALPPAPRRESLFEKLQRRETSMFATK